MCGIAGIVTRQGTLPEEGLLRRMSQAIAHRGPDGEGVWMDPGVGFAHRRLAIIDLHPTGRQPMRDTRQELTIIFNGEIYNFRELRAELEACGARFKTNSDTEVILEAYRAWGIDCLKKLRGMFAFALWDAPRKTLLLARDRIGKKPLFYGFTSARDLVFASELKALAPVLDLKPDWDAVRLFLGLQYVPSPRTGFHEVMQLEPGEYGIWDEKGWRMARYHSYDVEPQCILPSTDIDQKIRSLLDDAVKIRQLAADVSVGAFLSGGIDSATVVAFATRHVSRPLQTFTMGFTGDPRFDERTEARALAAAFHTDHQEFEATPEDLLACIDELVVHYDAPYADSSALPLWLLARATAKEMKVVLTGDGGDETFGGYRRYVAYQHALQMASIPLLPRIAAPASLWIGNLFGDVRFGKMSAAVEAVRQDPARAYGEMFCGSYFGSVALRDVFASDFLEQTQQADAVGFVARKMTQGGEIPPLQAAMQSDLTSYLPDDLNVKMDRATMRWGLEARAPFLDQHVVAFARSLPLNQKVYRGKTKVALRRALRDIVPDAVLSRRKRGFQVPLAEWFRGPLRSLLRDRLMDPHASIAPLLQTSSVARLIAENDRGVDHGNRLWMLLSLSIWLTRYSE